MSETTTPAAPTTAAPPIASKWEGLTRLILAAGSMVLLIAVLVYAYIAKDAQTATLVTGAIVTMATTGFNYFLGSSSGSDRKTELLAASPPVTTQPHI